MHSLHHIILHMPNITISISADLKKRMSQHEDINWSAVARQAIELKTAKLSAMDIMLADSNLTEQDILEDASIIKKRVWQKHKNSRK